MTKSHPSSPELPDLFRERKPPAPWKRIAFAVGAVLCFAAGFAGWVIPVVSGIPFWVGGAVLLAMASQTTRHAINAGERRLPLPWRKRIRATLGKVRRRRLRGALNLPDQAPRG